MQHSGRVAGGDINFTFNNSVDDISYDVNTGLMAILTGYTSSLVSVQGINAVGGSSQTLEIPNNNDQTVATNTAISNMVFTWGGTATDASVVGIPALGIDFVKDIPNKTITVSGTPTGNVNFTITTSGTSGTSVSGSGTISILGLPSGDEIHNFTATGLNSTFYTFTSANINSTAGNTTYDGLTLTARLKIESATLITYSTLAESTLTLVFDPTFNGMIKLNGVNYTAASGIVVIPSLPAGNYSITKNNTTNLFYIKTAYSTLSSNIFNKDDLTLYPNPVTNILYFNAPSSLNIEKIEVYDITGRLMNTGKLNENELDLSNLIKGNYIIKIYCLEGIISKKIIKN